MDKSDNSVDKKLPANDNQLGVLSVKNPENSHKELSFDFFGERLLSETHIKMYPY